MPKVKIPRKSTIIDMTAMCDVAFLLLSFFILATKQKPPEVLSVSTPSSVSSKTVPEKSIMITITKEGKAFLELGEETNKFAILQNINFERNLGLTPAELNKWNKSEFIGLPLNQIKSSLSLQGEISASNMPGIPIDSSNNEMVDWVRSITNAYAGTSQAELQDVILVKGDGQALYPFFKSIKEALKKNEIFKFRIVTSGESIPVGSELYSKEQKKVKAK